MAHPKKQFPLPNEGFCRINQILAVVPFGKTTFLKGVKAGRFPGIKPVKAGRSTFYPVKPVRELMERLEKGETI